MTVCVADFGLSKKIYSGDYYRQGRTPLKKDQENPNGYVTTSFSPIKGTSKSGDAGGGVRPGCQGGCTAWMLTLWPQFLPRHPGALGHPEKQLCQALWALDTLSWNELRRVRERLAPCSGWPLPWRLRVVQTLRPGASLVAQR